MTDKTVGLYEQDDDISYLDNTGEVDTSYSFDITDNIRRVIALTKRRPDGIDDRWNKKLSEMYEDWISAAEQAELNDLIAKDFFAFRQDHPPVSTETAKEYNWRIKAMFEKRLANEGVKITE